MYQITVGENELPWTDLGMPGVSMKVLHKDEVRFYPTKERIRPLADEVARCPIGPR